MDLGTPGTLGLVLCHTIEVSLMQSQDALGLLNTKPGDCDLEGLWIVHFDTEVM